jgi:hypothetical protein
MFANPRALRQFNTHSLIINSAKVNVLIVFVIIIVIVRLIVTIVIRPSGVRATARARRQSEVLRNRRQ